MRINLAAILFMIVGACCAVMAGIYLWKEIDEVNRKLPLERRISFLGMYTEKWLKVRRSYREFYPEGRLHRAVLGWEIAAIVSFFLAALSSGMFGR
jgi:hypothetical protein